jgi:hypothetical protein
MKMRILYPFGNITPKWKRHFNPWGQKKKTLGDLAKEEKKRQKLEKSQLGINYPS